MNCLGHLIIEFGVYSLIFSFVVFWFLFLVSSHIETQWSQFTPFFSFSDKTTRSKPLPTLQNPLLCMVSDTSKNEFLLIDFFLIIGNSSRNIPSTSPLGPLPRSLHTLRPLLLGHSPLAVLSPQKAPIPPLHLPCCGGGEG